MATTATDERDRTTPRKRGLRADALRNRAKVLAAARAEFGRVGTAAQIDDIARAAGVGVGTVYRHFPCKEDLFRALADEHFEGLAAAARRALENEDPWQGFVEFMTYGSRVAAEDRWLPEAMSIAAGVCADASERAGLPPLVDRLIARAQASGDLRPDVVRSDIPALVCGIGRAVTVANPGEPAMSWQRFLDFVLAGLRARD